MTIPLVTNSDPNNLIGTVNQLVNQVNAANATQTALSVGRPLLSALGDSLTSNGCNYGQYTLVMTPTNSSLASGTVTGGLPPTPAASPAAPGAGQAVANNCTMTAEGPYNWAAAFTYQNVKAPPTYIVGMPGMTSDVIRIYGLPIILALNPLPNVCIVNVGTNNLTCIDGGKTASFIINDLSLIYAALINAGIKVIAFPLLPRSDTAFTALSATNQIIQAGVQRQVNQWIYNQASVQNGLYVADSLNQLSAPTSTLMDIVKNVTYGSDTNIAPMFRQDYLHPSTGGCFAQGQSIGSVLNFIYPNRVSFLPKNNAQYNVATTGSNPFDNLLPNAMFTTTSAVSGATGAGAAQITGTQPTGYVLSNTDVNTLIAVTCASGSLVNPTWNGNLMTMVFSGTYNKPAQTNTASTPDSNFARVIYTVGNTTAGWAVGDLVEGYCYIEIPGAQTIQGIGAIGIQIQGVSSTIYNQCLKQNFNPLPIGTNSATTSYVAYCNPYQLNAADVANGFIKMTIYIYFDGAGASANATQAIAGTIKVGLPIMQRVH